MGKMVLVGLVVFVMVGFMFPDLGVAMSLILISLMVLRTLD